MVNKHLALATLPLATRNHRSGARSFASSMRAAARRRSRTL